MFSQAPALPCGSFEEKRPIVNEDEPRMDTNRHRRRDGPPSTTSGTKMLLPFGALGVTMSWDDGFPGARASRPHNDGFPGARASRPHQAWHSLGPSPPLGSTGNGAMGLLRPGRCCSRRKGGCLQHRTEAQRRPQGTGCGRDARAPRRCTSRRCGGECRRSRAARRRLMRWGVFSE